MSVFAKRGGSAGRGLDRDASLRGIPVLDSAVIIEEPETLCDGGLMLVSRRVRGRRGWLGRFGPPMIEKRVQLDELGAYVVRLFDGERNVKEIAALFAETFKVNKREAELCTASFLKSLVRRRMAAIVMR